jgi:hypothetical protein
MFERAATQVVGDITVTTDLTNISSLARYSRSIRRIVFVGDLSNVTDIANAFQLTSSLLKLILPNLTIGFDISYTAMSGTPLQDLFTSLGNANGAQTLTLAAFTIGQSTTIATNKGYTIAYA